MSVPSDDDFVARGPLHATNRATGDKFLVSAKLQPPIDESYELAIASCDRLVDQMKVLVTGQKYRELFVCNLET